MASDNDMCPVCTAGAQFGDFSVVQFKGLGFFLRSKKGGTDIQINFCPECGVMLREESTLPPHSVTTQQYLADCDEQVEEARSEALTEGKKQGRAELMQKLHEFLSNNENKQEDDF